MIERRIASLKNYSSKARKTAPYVPLSLLGRLIRTQNGYYVVSFGVSVHGDGKG